MSAQDQINTELAKEIDSLHQQVTISTIVLGAALKEIALSDQSAAKRILENVQLILDELDSQITAERAKMLRNLLETALKEESHVQQSV